MEKEKERKTLFRFPFIVSRCLHRFGTPQAVCLQHPTKGGLKPVYRRGQGATREKKNYKERKPKWRRFSPTSFFREEIAANRELLPKKEEKSKRKEWLGTRARHKTSPDWKYDGLKPVITLPLARIYLVTGENWDTSQFSVWELSLEEPILSYKRQATSSSDSNMSSIFSVSNNLLVIICFFIVKFKSFFLYK